MRKILVIGAAIGLAAALASSVQAEVEQVEAIEMVLVKDFVDSKFAITPTEPLELEPVAYSVGYVPIDQVEYVEVALPAGESTKLAANHLVMQTEHSDYRQRYEVGWRF